MYVPAAHAIHVPPSGPVKPALHVQEVAAEVWAGALELAGHATQYVPSVAPTVTENLTVGQAVHVSFPISNLKVPAGHSMHGPSSGPV